MIISPWVLECLSSLFGATAVQRQGLPSTMLACCTDRRGDKPRADWRSSLFWGRASKPRVAAPLSLVHIQARRAVFPTGRHNALNPVPFDLRSDEDAATADPLGIGVNLLL